MKITIPANKYRDKFLFVELFDTAVAIYEEHARDAGIDDRLKEQFLRQKARGATLTLWLWKQKSEHEIVFPLDEGETDRWLILNMMGTSIDVLRHIADDIKNQAARALYVQRIARAEELRVMVEDASEHV